MSFGDFRVTFTVHGRCAEAFIRKRIEDWITKPREGCVLSIEERAAEFRKMVEDGEIPVPMAPMSAAFDTRQRAEQYADLAKSGGAVDVSIVTSYRRLNPETGKFRVTHSVPPEVAAIAQAHSAV